MADYSTKLRGMFSVENWIKGHVDKGKKSLITCKAATRNVGAYLLRPLRDQFIFGLKNTDSQTKLLLVDNSPR